MPQANYYTGTATLEDAIILAVQKHRGQTDRSGIPYVLHLFRVMMRVHGMEGKMVSVLHDSIEDTNTTAQELLDAGFSQYVVDGVISVTRGPNETRLEAAQRSAAHRLGCEVKLADLMDNMNLARLSDISERDALRYAEYCEVKQILMDAKENRWNNFLPDDFLKLGD